MKKASHKKVWIQGALKMHMDPPPIPLLKMNNNAKLDKDSVKLNCIGILRQKFGSFWIKNGLV